MCNIYLFLNLYENYHGGFFRTYDILLKRLSVLKVIFWSVALSYRNAVKNTVNSLCSINYDFLFICTFYKILKKYCQNFRIKLRPLYALFFRPNPDTLFNLFAKVDRDISAGKSNFYLTLYVPIILIKNNID